jgi:hypothetical protein
MGQQPAADLGGGAGRGVSQITRICSPAGTCRSMRARNRLNPMARCRAVSREMTIPDATSKAAYRLVVPWQRSSWLRRWATPGSSGRIGAARSSAWIWCCASTHSATVTSGGFRYSPQLSRALSMICGSVDNLASSKCGLSTGSLPPRQRQVGRQARPRRPGGPFDRRPLHPPPVRVSAPSRAVDGVSSGAV